MQAWINFLNLQEQKLGKQTVDRWLRPLKIVHFDSGNLHLEAKDAFAISWFEEHIRPFLKKELFNNNYRSIKVHIRLTAGSIAPTKSVDIAHKQPPSFTLYPDPLNPHYTLDQFICGQSNPLLMQFFLELTKKNQLPSEPIHLGTFNPIVYYGAPGTGKTHLLIALTHAFRQNGLSALYVRAETFTDHLVQAIRNSEMQKFRHHYRNVDLLLVDDIHIFARRFATQEEFFHTFNALQTANKQIICTSHLPPSLLEEIEPRLISRFEWGIVLHLEKLQKQELKEVLLQRSIQLLCPLEKEAIDFLIETFPSNPQSIEQALNALVLRKHLYLQYSPATPLNSLQIKDLLKDLIAANQTQSITPQMIIATVSSYYDIRIEDILGTSHMQEYTFPRQLAIYLCRTELQLPFMKIGAIFNRDHSTIMTSVKQIKSKLNQLDNDTPSILKEIQHKLEENKKKPKKR